jgi:hypothetical protein
VKEKLGISTQEPQKVQIPGAAVGLPNGTPTTTLKATDIRQFVEEKQPKNDIQFAAVVAYFYQFVAPEGQRKERISADILIEGCRLAQHKRPAKAKWTLTNAVAAGYLDRVGAGEFSLNSVGENLVAMILPNKETIPTKKSSKIKVKSDKNTKPKIKG